MTALRLSAVAIQRAIDDTVHEELLAEIRRFVDTREEVTSDRGVSLRGVVEGMDLWELVRARIAWRIRHRLYAYLLVERLVRERCPSEIVVEDAMPDFARAARWIGTTHALPVRETWRRRIALERFLEPPRTATRFVERLRPRLATRRSVRGAILVAFEYLEELKMILPTVELLLEEGNAVALCPLDGRERLSQSPLYRRWLRAHPRAAHVSPDDSTFRGSEPRVDHAALREIHARFFVRNGISLQPLIEREVTGEIGAPRVRRVARRWQCLRSIVRTVRPALGVVTNPYGVMLRCLVTACREEDVPTLLVPHHADQLGESLRVSGCTADHAAVMGPRVAAMLEAQGVSPDRVHVTGAPWFDAVARARPELGSSRGVTFVAQGLRQEGTRVRSIVRGLDASKLTIRPHPKHWAFPYRMLVWKDGLRTKVSRGAGLHPQLAASDLVIGVNSVALLEAIHLDRPVVALADPTMVERPLALAYGACALAPPDELPAIVDRLRHDAAFAQQLANGRRALLADFFAGNGEASARIARLVHQLSQESHTTAAPVAPVSELAHPAAHE